MAGARSIFAPRIALQFGVQNFLLEQWLAPGRTPGETGASHTFISGSISRRNCKTHAPSSAMVSPSATA